jgi:hypothetical protein
MPSSCTSLRARRVRAALRAAASGSPGRGLNHTPPPPERPTDALPGTEERVRIYAERVSRGRSIFHPRDATGD